METSMTCANGNTSLMCIVANVEWCTPTMCINTTGQREAMNYDELSASNFPNLTGMDSRDLFLLLSAYIDSAFLEKDKAFLVAIQDELKRRKEKP